MKYVLQIYANGFGDYSLPVASIAEAKSHLSDFLNNHVKKLGYKNIYGIYGSGYLYLENDLSYPVHCFEIVERGIRRVHC